MKKYLLLFFVFCLAAIIYLSFPLSKAEHFVRLKDKRFFLDDQEFYPVTLNYMVSVQTDGKILWPSAYTGYNAGFKNLYTTKDSCLMQLRADMDLIKEMGFNTVRFVSIGEEIIDKQTGRLSVGAAVGNDHNTQMELSNNQNYETYFGALDDLFTIAREAGLKVIFLLRMSADIPSTEYHLMKVTKRFRNETSILAYDFFNEPLYFDSLERSKEAVYNTVKRWNRIVEMYAPDQLSTIGLEGIREVFEWDPNMLDVDFLTFHPYEYEPEQVRNELYWYGKYITKPWMVGETAIPADNDSVSYTDQYQFALKTLKQARDCGAIGYAWWQYKDVEWYSFHANFMGVVNMKGETRTKRNDLIIKGSVKPVAEAFRNYNPNAAKGDCVCLDNYYNYSKNKNRTFRITGRMTDEDNEPIEGGVILAWNQWWSHSYHTITKADGSFELLGDYPFYHWMASSTMYSMVRGDILPDTAKKAAGQLPTIDLGTLKLDPLSLD